MSPDQVVICLIVFVLILIMAPVSVLAVLRKVGIRLSDTNKDLVSLKKASKNLEKGNCMNCGGSLIVWRQEFNIQKCSGCESYVYHNSHPFTNGGTIMKVFTGLDEVEKFIEDEEFNKDGYLIEESWVIEKIT